MTNYYFTGDWHAQTRGADDDFNGYPVCDGLSHGDVCAMALARKCAAEGARHIASEMFELQEGLRKAAHRNLLRALDLIWGAHPGIREIWPYTEVAIIGNHEWPIKPGFVYRGVEFVDNAVIGNVWIEHGHAHDPLISRKPWTWVSPQLAWLQGWLERNVDSDFDLYIAHLRRWLSGTGRYGPNAPYRLAVAGEAVKHGCHQALFGHTHKGWRMSPLWRYEDAVAGREPYMHIGNTGCCCNGRFDVTRLEVNGA